jgi:hypothetical protein
LIQVNRSARGEAVLDASLNSHQREGERQDRGRGVERHADGEGARQPEQAACERDAEESGK